MRRGFLSLSPEKRYGHLRSIVKTMKLRASTLPAPFTILLYGSGSYGFNKKIESKMDDLDLFLVFPRNSNIPQLISTAERVFGTEFDIRSEYLTAMCAGEWEMCRMYGKVDDTKLGFRLMCQDTFESLASRRGV